MVTPRVRRGHEASDHALALLRLARRTPGASGVGFYTSALGYKHSRNDAREKRDRLTAVSPTPNHIFGSGGCALGFFDLEVASDGIEHGHFSLVDRCDGIVDGERSVFVQQPGIIRSRFDVKIVLPLGYFRL